LKKLNNLTTYIFGLILISNSLFCSVPENFPFVKNIDGNLTPNKFYSILLDEDIWVNLNKDKSNIRLFDDEKNEVPFVLKQKKTFKKIKKSIPIDSKLVHMSHPKDNSIDIIFKLKKVKDIDSIEIKTKVQNFEKNISIYGSNSKENWALLKEDTIFDYSSIINHHKLKVKLPKSSYNYYKIKINNVIENSESPIISLSVENGISDKNIINYRKTIYKKTFKVDHVIFYFSQSKLIPTSAVETEPKTPSWSAHIEENSHKTEVLIDSIGAPLQSITIDTKRKVFERPMTVQVLKNNSKTWRTIRNLKMKTNKNNRFLISLNGASGKQFRLIINNEDNPPISITSLQLNRRRYHFVFSPNQETPLSIYYGGQTDHFPTYDIQKYSQTQEFISELRKMNVLKISHQKNNAFYDPDISNTKNSDEKDYSFLFKLALFLLVLVLIGVITLVSKKVGKITDDEE